MSISCNGDYPLIQNAAEKLTNEGGPAFPAPEASILADERRK
jgi:hypothetical protein